MIAVDKRGYYGEFGGAYIPEMLYPNIEELRENYLDIMQDAAFQREFRQLLKDFANLPEAEGQGEDVNYFSLACFLYPNFYFTNEQVEEQDETEGNKKNATEK